MEGYFVFSGIDEGVDGLGGGYFLLHKYLSC